MVATFPSGLWPLTPFLATLFFFGLAVFWKKLPFTGYDVEAPFSCHAVFFAPLYYLSFVDEAGAGVVFPINSHRDTDAGGANVCDVLVLSSPALLGIFQLRQRAGVVFSANTFHGRFDRCCSPGTFPQ